MITRFLFKLSTDSNNSIGLKKKTIYMYYLYLLLYQKFHDKILNTQRKNKIIIGTI